MQGFLISPILFLIYINQVLNKVIKTCFLITFFSFIDNLEFITLDSLVKEMIKTIEKTAKIVIK